MSSKGNNSWVLVGKDGRPHDLSHGMIFIGREECDIVLQVVCNSVNRSYICLYMPSLLCETFSSILMAVFLV